MEDAMRIDILVSDAGHPTFEYLRDFVESLARTDDAELHLSSPELRGGDFLFLVSCQEVIRSSLRSKYRYSLVLHESDLPQGRGWSPLVWQILERRTNITVSLIDAADPVDTGDIWSQETVLVEDHEVLSEIAQKIALAKIRLMKWAMINCFSATPSPQKGTPSYYRRRIPEDSRIDPCRPIAEQFDLMRIADPERYPCFFDIRGHRYKIFIEKVEIQ